MEKVKQYIEELLGDPITLLSVKDKELGSVLPFYMTEMYSFSKIVMMNHSLILIEPKQQDELSILQLSKHQALIEEMLHCKSAVVLQEIESFQRKRLIEKRVQFIVPNKQIFLPFWLIDLKEGYATKRQKKDSLSPSAQMILIWYLLDKQRKIDFENSSLKDLANHFNYSAMTITKAADELVSHDLCTLRENGKEKFIHFQQEKHELWHRAEPYLVNPVLKTIFVDEFPDGVGHILSNFSALSEYSEMNPSSQRYYAIDKTVFYGLEKTGKFKNSNNREGKYCIEVWKYNPDKLMEIVHNDEFAVDPLSLYLSMKGNPDERTEYAFENLINHIW
jgi:DNA-binding MarR family transcriptional regulator